MKRFLLILTLLWILVGCAQAEPEIIEREVVVTQVVERVVEVEGETAVKEVGVSEIGRNQRNQQTRRLIIKTGNMSIEVDDIDTAVADAIALVAGQGGYIVSQNVSGAGRYRNASLTLGVPVDSFEMMMETFRELGEVESESATGEDITEEFVDLTSMLENLTATQARLRDLLTTATNVEETLEVDRELRQIEGEINIVQGRMKYLSERARFLHHYTQPLIYRRNPHSDPARLDARGNGRTRFCRVARHSAERQRGSHLL